jgi:hypothetical protein
VEATYTIKGNANLVATTDSVDRLLAIDNNQLSRASFVSTLLPLVAGILGVILLVVGWLTARRPVEDIADRLPPAHQAGGRRS